MKTLTPAGVRVFLYPSFCPIAAVKAAVADGFGDMLALDFLGLIQIGNRAGHLQDTAVGPGGELEAFHRHTEHIE